MSWIEKTDLPSMNAETSTALSLRMAACVSLELDGRLEACMWVRCIQMQEKKTTSTCTALSVVGYLSKV
jgi:hypothetical protein